MIANEPIIHHTAFNNEENQFYIVGYKRPYHEKYETIQLRKLRVL